MVTSKNKEVYNNKLNTITNRVYVKSDGRKILYANATVLINKVSDLCVTQTLNCNKFKVNKIITYTINVKNNGPSKASGVVLKEIFPSSVIFDSIVLSQGTFTLKKNGILCYLGSITRGEEVIVTLKVIIKENCPVINSVFVIGNEPDPDKKNNVNFLGLYDKKNPNYDVYTIIALTILYKIICYNSFPYGIKLEK